MILYLDILSHFGCKLSMMGRKYPHWQRKQLRVKKKLLVWCGVILLPFCSTAKNISSTIPKVSQKAIQISSLGSRHLPGENPLSAKEIAPQRDSSSFSDCERELSPANAGLDQRVCTDQSFLQAAAVESGTGQWSLISGAGTIADPFSDKTLATGLQPGENVFVWTVSSLGCTPLMDTVVISRDSCTEASPGPIEVERLGNIHLTAASKGAKVVLTWEVSAEFGVSNYTVEKSLDRIFFQSLGTLSSQGNTEDIQFYQFPIEDRGKDTVYYRVSVRMNSGNIFQSDLLVLSPFFSPKGPPRLLLFPNPILDNTLNISVKSQTHWNGYLTLSDTRGKVLKQYPANLFPGIATFALSAHNLPKGVYVLSLFYEPFLPPVQEKVWLP